MNNGFQISRKSDYALRAVICLANQASDQLLSFRQIALTECIPEDYLAKILRSLVVAKLVYSVRGSKGGYSLARGSEDISFLDVIEAVDGPIVINLCLGDGAECPLQLRCSMHAIWRKAQDAMLKVLRETSLQDVASPNPTALKMPQERIYPYEV